MPRNNWVDNTTAVTAATLNAMVVMDTTEASTMDAVSTSNDITSNSSRLRNQLGIVIGGVGAAWNAAVQMLPLSQKGAASGVAGYDSRGLITRPTGTSTPTITIGAGWPGGTFSLTAGSDSRAGQIVITPNANLAANTSLITFAVNPTSGATMRGVVVGQSGGSAWVGFWHNKITNGFTLINASALSSGVTYACDYIIEP